MKEGIKIFLYSKSKTFMAFCFCFLVGVVLASFVNLPTGADKMFYTASFVILFLTFILWRRRVLRLSIFCSFFLLFGVWRMAVTIPDCSSPNKLCNYYDQKVEFVGRISKEPDRRIERAYYIVDVSKVDSQAVTGRIRISTRIYPEYNFGDILVVSCKLKQPENFSDSTFFYDKYLARQGIWSVCQFGRVSILDSNSGWSSQPRQGGRDSDGDLDFGLRRDNKWRTHERMLRSILFLKNKVATQIDLLWPEPESSFMAGLLYGSRAGLPKELSENFNRTGATHIIAISGYNITIIVVALMGVFIRLGLYRQQAFWLTVFGIAVFVVFTGASPSVTRAGIMGGIVLLAQYLGRLSRIGNILIFTAVLMSLVNPYILVWDAGFQLSFLATLGLVYLSPLLDRLIPVSNMAIIKGLRATTLATMSAIIFTLPLMLYQFGRLSVVAPLVNVLILFLIPWVMLIGFVATLLSFMYFPLGQLVALVGSFGLKYIIAVVDFFGRQSFASVELQLSLWVMLVLYLILFLFVSKKQKTIPTL